MYEKQTIFFIVMYQSNNIAFLSYFAISFAFQFSFPV